MRLSPPIDVHNKPYYHPKNPLFGEIIVGFFFGLVLSPYSAGIILYIIYLIVVALAYKYRLSSSILSTISFVLFSLIGYIVGRYIVILYGSPFENEKKSNI
jgi:uncharacterized membrane protein YeaQ/YmgE (transglycosylase-associated protein family)